MNKVFKKLISVLVIVCTISSVSLAATRPANAKGTVIGEGTAEDPFKLVLGEEIIDLYYKEGSSKFVYFEFTSGSYNSAAYMVEHNSDKERIRLTLLGTSEEYKNVKAEEGINYLQAGAKSLKTSSETNSGDEDSENKIDMQSPYYRITSTEKFGAFRNDGKRMNLGHSVDLGVVYNEDLLEQYNLLNTEYSTFYVFSKSNLPYSSAYKITDDQKENAKISYKMYNDNNRVDYTAYGTFEGSSTIKEKVKETTSSEKIDYVDRSYTNFGSVNVVYTFRGTSSEVEDSSEAVAGDIEKIISKFLISIGDLFVKLTKIGGDGGETIISVDTLVFNEYPNTMVDFWGDTEYMNTYAKSVITKWFNIFKAWAIIVYIILLVYIGIKTVLLSGTSEQKKVKGILEGWLEGLLLLFFLPFLFKYLIQINDAFVDIMRVNSKYSIHAYYTFENLYKDLGGQEDGEDSTTTILERLKNAKKTLAKDTLELQEGMRDLENEKQEIIDKLDDKDFWNGIGEWFEELAFNSSKDGVVNFYEKREGLTISKDGVTKDADAIDEDITEISKEFFSSGDNITTYLTKDEIEKAINENEELQNLIKDYVYNLEYTFENGRAITVTELEKFHDKVKSFAENIIKREAENIISNNYEVMKEALEKEIAEKQAKMDELDEVILKIENGDADLMGDMRRKAGKTYRIFYVIVWYILLFELIILLIMYYKRLFMLMILVIVFPLVTLAYAYGKSKGGKPTVFKNWVQEYIVNVFIQSIHAILYVTLVEAGYSVYIADNDNWLIFVLALTGLIIVEPIFKNIIGVKGSTVSDLTKSGAKAFAAAYAAKSVASTITSTGKDLENIDNQYKNNEVDVKKKDAKEDKRTNTKRLERDNKVRKDGTKTEAEKKEQLRKNKEKDKEEDKKKEEARKDKAQKRAKKRQRQMRARLLKNSAAAFGTVVGGIAAGGDPQDFVKAAGIANALSGTNQKPIKATKEAEKLDKERKAAEEEEKQKKQREKDLERAKKSNGENSGNSGENENSGGNGNSGGGSDSGGPIFESADGISNRARTSQRNPQFASRYAQRLEEEKVYTKKKYHFREEDSN